MLSPARTRGVNHHGFVPDDTYAATVDLATHRAASTLDDLDLDLDVISTRSTAQRVARTPTPGPPAWFPKQRVEMTDWRGFKARLCFLSTRPQADPGGPIKPLVY